MIISHQLKSILIHVQKSAGASIGQALLNGDPSAETGLHAGRPHRFAREVRALVEPVTWTGGYRFAGTRTR